MYFPLLMRGSGRMGWNQGPFGMKIGVDSAFDF